MRPAVIVAIVLSAVALAGALALAAGVGNDPIAARPTTLHTRPPVTQPPNTNTALSEKEAFVIGVAVTTARTACGEPGVGIPAGQVRSRVNDLIRLAKRKPDDIGTAFGEPKNTPRNGLKQVIAALEEDACAPAVAETAREALASL